MLPLCGNLQYSPYTFTVALLDITDPASLLTIHLYMYCPTAMLLLVVYDGLLALLIGAHLLLDLLSQEYISVPSPSALHVRVVVLLNGMVASLGCVVIDGGLVAKVKKYIHNYSLTIVIINFI